MTRETKTFEVEYKRFDVGEKVKAGSTRCPLEQGKTYEVTEFHAPMFPGEDAIIFVKGEKYGISAEYVVPA